MGRPEPLDLVEAALCARFGSEPAAASVSFVGVDPVEILRFALNADELVYVSLGMSRRPMPARSAGVVDSDGPRAELVLQLHARSGADDAWRQLAVLAAAPAVEGVAYVPGMTVELGRPIAAGSRCTGALVTPFAAPAGAPIDSPVGPVALLRLVPATATELAWCRIHGSDALQQRWSASGTDLLDLARDPAQLS